MKANHHSFAYKIQAQPDKTYKDLRQKQKAKISNWMYQATSEYYEAHGKMPEDEAADQIVVKIYGKISSLAIQVTYGEVHHVFLSKLPRYEKRIMEARLSEPAQTRSKQKPTSTTPKKKKGNSNKVCPNCGRKIKQQFIGLQHCRCGVSWKKGEGFFERSSEMVVAFERHVIGEKVKQCPIIRYRDDG